MSTPAYQWSHEHFCEPDTIQLHSDEPARVVEFGYPVQLDAPPEPATFCSVCLKFFTNPQPDEGSDPRPPQDKEPQ